MNMPEKQLASILVGDHLGQVKKVLWPSGEVSSLGDLAEPCKSNPIVSIEPIPGCRNKHLIASKQGYLYIHDSIKGKTKACETKGDDLLIKALPVSLTDIALVYEKHIVFDAANQTVKHKKGQIRNALVHDNKLAIVGKDIPLKVFDVKTRNKVYEADLPEKNWLGLQPECEVVGLDFVGQTRVATCSKSDSVIRVYDMANGNSKPIITVDIGQTAFIEHAEAGRFLSVASTGDQGHSLVVGSNVGQLIAIDLRFNVKRLHPKKRLQPKTFKILGGFKGARGATFKDIKIVPAAMEDNVSYKVISCCLDRYMRIHNFSKTTRQLDKHVYMKTKPLCCSPIFYEDI